jgi:23S rRNA (adenine2503-C2)-methyltransferase
MSALALQAMTPDALASRLGITLAEARKIVSTVHRWRSLDEPLQGVRRSALLAVRASGVVPTLGLRARQASTIDPFVKFALETPDAHVIETVRIPLEKSGRFSVCVSSQIGCALACAFCATGRLGLERNLETWEIVEQVRTVAKELAAQPTNVSARARVHGVVFQGMGEPMSNLDRVLEAIFVLCDPSALAIDARAMTVCTAGVPSGIRRLAKEAPKVRLGLSIGSARPDVRRSLMPIARANPLAEVLDAAAEHARVTGLAPMWAVTPLAGVNDTEEDGRALGALAMDFASKTGKRPRISVIPYNAIDEGDRDPFVRTSAARETAFRAALRDAGFGSHMRYSGGGDVNAACGQLAAKA